MQTVPFRAEKITTRENSSYKFGRKNYLFRSLKVGHDKLVTFIVNFERPNDLGFGYFPYLTYNTRVCVTIRKSFNTLHLFAVIILSNIRF